MVPTILGLIVTALCLYFMRGPASPLLMLVVFLNLFGSASALDLPAIGGSSIQPAHFALVFLVLRLVFSGSETLPLLTDSLRRNIFLVAFGLYGAVTAFILPKIFAGEIGVVPLRVPSLFSLYSVFPLRFSPQNITAAVYLLGTMIAAVATTIIARREGRADLLVNIAIAIGIAHVFLGVMGAVLSSLGLSEYMDIVRNASYAQVDQEVAGMKRLSGTFSEPSLYATFGYFWFVFLVELWLRHVRPTWTATLALAVGLAVLFSTSSTGYVSLAGYALILMLRILIFPGQFSFPKILSMLACMFGGVTILLLIAVANEQLWRSLSGIVQSMTVGKLQSSSGLQRSFWARQGLELFVFSNGLGVGIGSFRSSSLYTAILGSVGVFGMATFLAHLWLVFRPLATVTYSLRQNGTQAIGSAAAWTAIAGLIPSLVVAPSADPGLLFGIFSGFALAWHRIARPARPAARAALPAAIRHPVQRG